MEIYANIFLAFLVFRHDFIIHIDFKIFIFHSIRFLVFNYDIIMAHNYFSQLEA